MLCYCIGYSNCKVQSIASHTWIQREDGSHKKIYIARLNKHKQVLYISTYNCINR